MKKVIVMLFYSFFNLAASAEVFENIKFTCYVNGVVTFSGLISFGEINWINPVSSSDANIMFNGVLPNDLPLALTCESYRHREANPAEMQLIESTKKLKPKSDVDSFSIFSGDHVVLTCYTKHGRIIFKGTYRSFEAEWVNPSSSDDANMLVYVNDSNSTNTCAYVKAKGS